MTIPSTQDLARECARIRGALPAEPLGSGLRIALYGAGFLGAWAVRWLRRSGVEPMACIDSNPARHGERFLGVEVHGPADLASLAPDLVFITARHAVQPIEAALHTHGIRACALDAYFVATHEKAFLDIHDHLLADTRSQETLRSVLAAMLTGTCRHLEPVCERDQYFCLPRFAGSERETYVDAGAYVGDSVERFIWASAGAFARIHAFEPSARQFAALEKRVGRLTAEWALAADAILLNRVGLSDTRARMAAATSSGELQTMSLAEADDGTIATETLDACLAGERITFLKADVEGLELPLLKGAAGTIARDRPKLAICVYHYPADIPEIATYIRDLVPAYRFALRHHSPRLMETVLYCWTE